jgi:V8-like Glu-specific endopeptidase
MDGSSCGNATDTNAVECATTRGGEFDATTLTVAIEYPFTISKESQITSYNSNDGGLSNMSKLTRNVVENLNNLKAALFRSIILVGLITFISFLSQPAQAATLAPAWVDHYRNSTVLLSGPYVGNNGQQNEFVCTGLLVSTTSTLQSTYMVTAKHCFTNAETLGLKSLHITFGWQNINLSDESEKFNLTLISNSGKHLWTEASNGHDIAGVSLLQIHGNPTNHNIDAIGPQDFAAREDLYETSPIFVYGYPALAKTRLTKAIARGGIVAWTDTNSPYSSPFLIDCAIFPGNSGGPVFKSPSSLNRAGSFQVGSKVALLGIAIQTYQAALNSEHPDVGVTGLGSLGVVEPISQILKILKDMGAPDIPTLR